MMDDDAARTGELLGLQLARATAINAYAQFEQSLCRLFGLLLGTQLQLAATVFYRITNTHSRNRIIEELLEIRHKGGYAAYWNGIPNTPDRSGMITIIRQLDQARNEIVHWHITSRFNPGDTEPMQIGLMKPDVWPIVYAARRTITAAEMHDFSGKADFVTRSLNLFFLKLQGKLDAPEMRATWQEIFSQPASYPPPDTSPLSRSYKAPETPPPPSGA